MLKRKRNFGKIFILFWYGVGSLRIALKKGIFLNDFLENFPALQARRGPTARRGSSEKSLWSTPTFLSPSCKRQYFFYETEMFFISGAHVGGRCMKKKWKSETSAPQSWAPNAGWTEISFRKNKGKALFAPFNIFISLSRNGLRRVPREIIKSLNETK